MWSSNDHAYAHVSMMFRVSSPDEFLIIFCPKHFKQFGETQHMDNTISTVGGVTPFTESV